MHWTLIKYYLVREIFELCKINLTFRNKKSKKEKKQSALGYLQPSQNCIACSKKICPFYHLVPDGCHTINDKPLVSIQKKRDADTCTDIDRKRIYSMYDTVLVMGSELK